MLIFGPPAVRGLGNAGGFKLMVEATGEADFDALQAQADNLVAKGNQQTGPGGPLQWLPRPHAAALCGY